MKMFKRLFILFILSVIIAIALFFVNSNVIVTTWIGRISEVVFLTIPVFIIVSILYFANRALIKTVKGIKKKKPSGKEGSGI